MAKSEGADALYLALTSQCACSSNPENRRSDQLVERFDSPPIGAKSCTVNMNSVPMLCNRDVATMKLT